MNNILILLMGEDIGEKLLLEHHPGEAGTGNVYEVICFNKALNNSEITTINEKLFKYYPIV